MSKEEHRFPRGLLHPRCADDEPGQRSAGSPHNHDDMDCATLDEQEAWRIIVNRAGLNADMLAGAKHTDKEFVWSFERPEGQKENDG